MALGSKASADLEAPKTTEDTEVMSPVDLDASLNEMFSSLGDHHWDAMLESIRGEPSAHMPH